jgi:hypothetical protein
MLRTLVVGFWARASSIALVLLLCFCLAATAGEMTLSLLIANATIDIVIERTSPRVPLKDICSLAPTGRGVRLHLLRPHSGASSLGSNYSLHARRVSILNVGTAVLALLASSKPKLGPAACISICEA